MTTTDDIVDPTYATLTHFVKLGSENYGDSLVFRADTVDDLLQDVKEAAELSKELVDAGATLKEAFGAVKAKAEEKNSRPSRGASRGGGTSRSGSTARSARPGSRPARRGSSKTEEPPLSDELCDCGEPYKDLDGMTYKSGAKRGQPYPNRFYASCDNRDCKPFGEQS